MTSFQCYKMLKQIAFLAMLCIMAGCATTQTSDNYANKDTLEPANRVFFDVNETLDQALIKPIAEVYVDVAPNFIRTGITNFFNNLASCRFAIGSRNRNNYGSFIEFKK